MPCLISPHLFHWFEHILLHDILQWDWAQVIKTYNSPPSYMLNNKNNIIANLFHYLLLLVYAWLADHEEWGLTYSAPISILHSHCTKSHPLPFFLKTGVDLAEFLKVINIGLLISELGNMSSWWVIGKWRLSGSSWIRLYNRLVRVKSGYGIRDQHWNFVTFYS